MNLGVRFFSWAVVLAASACGGHGSSPADAPPPPDADSSSALTSFAFLTASNAGLIQDVVATITGTTITATLPIGTRRDQLVATFTTTGADVRVAGALQTSGATANDFENPVTYVVEAADGATTTSYDVTVKVHGVSPFPFPAGQRPAAVAIADVDGDGKPDIAAAESAGRRGIELLHNQTVAGATPDFSAPLPFITPNNSSPLDIAIADIDGDGKPDVVLATSTVWVAINTSLVGTPSFATMVDTGIVGFALAAGDLDGDGKPDLAMAKAGAADLVEVTLNRTAVGGPPVFSPTVKLATGSAPTSVAIGDLNGDGKADLAVSNNNASTVSVFLNTTLPGDATASFSAKVDFAVPGLARRVRMIDVDGDGRLDLAVANNRAFQPSVSVLVNTTTANATTATFATHVEFATATCPVGLAVGDLDGDGRPDLVTSSNNCPGQVALLLDTTAQGSSAPSFALPANLADTQQGADVALDDLNADGLLDVVFVDQGNGSADGGVVVLLAN